MKKQKFFLISAFGKDRPGMVSGVAGVLLKLGANLEDASMTRLGGEFSMMLVAVLPSTVSETSLKKALNPLRRLGLEASAKPIPAKEALLKTRDTAPNAILSVYGTDHPGIVHAVTQHLAKRRVNITDLNTKVVRGTQDVYIMLLEVQLPKNLTVETLESDLESLHQSLGVQLTLQPLDPVEL